MADRHDVQLRTKLLEKIFPSVDTVDNLESDNPNRPLSARQGKVLKELINAGGGGGSGLSIEVVESLPTTGVKGILYLVPKTSYLKEENTYDEYVWIESSQKYELLGSFSTDLNIEEYVDKINSILGEIGEINVATLSDYGINSYVTTGTYRVHGERINSNDGLPILNAANGHTVEGILKVYNSSIAGTGKNTDKVVTQMLSMSNRHGGDGHIWIRTGQGASEDNLTWSTWEKLQGIFEKNTIENINELNTFTTNGIYSCMYVGPDVFDDMPLHAGDTLLVVVVNGYMASSIGATPYLIQSIIKSGETQYSIIIRRGFWTGSRWNFIPYPTLIDNQVEIMNRVAIGTYAPDAGWTEIHSGSQLTTDGNGFNIRNINKSAGLTLADNTNLSIKGGKTSSVEYKQANAMVINSSSVTLGNGGGSINIGSTINIEDRIIIGNDISIGETFNSMKNVSIGNSVYMKGSINIGNNVNIDNGVKIVNETNGLKISTITGNSLTISTSECSISIASPNKTGNLNFANNSIITFNEESIKLGNGTGRIDIAGDIVIENHLRIVNKSLTIGTIVFNENNIIFQVGGKSATLQLS